MDRKLIIPKNCFERRLQDPEMYAEDMQGQKSLTVPNQTLTIAEVMQRFVKSLPLGVNERSQDEGYYGEFEDPEDSLVPPFYGDITEKREYMEMLNNKADFEKSEIARLQLKQQEDYEQQQRQKFDQYYNERAEKDK